MNQKMFRIKRGKVVVLKKFEIKKKLFINLKRKKIHNPIIFIATLNKMSAL